MNLYSDYLIDYFGDNNEALEAFSKLIPSRMKILEILKQYKKDFGTLHIKEKYGSVYLNKELFEEGTTYIIIEGNGLADIKSKIDTLEFNEEYKYELDFIKYEDVLNINLLIDFLNEIDNNKFKRIKISGFDVLFNKILEMEENKDLRREFVNNLQNIGVDANYDNYYYIWFKWIIDKFYEKFLFSIELNDYIFYDENSNYDLLFESLKIFLDKSFLDEIVIKMNYFTWADEYDSVINKFKEINYGQLISLSFDGLMPLNEHYKSVDSNERVSFDDFYNYMMVLERIYEKFKSFEQFYGFEIDGGFIGYDVYKEIRVYDEDIFENLKKVLCDNRNVLANYYDKIVLYKDDKNFVCVNSF